jgi:hypothetical protein
MAAAFDPYHRWLGIPPKDQPANLYRLLAISLFESDPDVIDQAADQRVRHLRSLATGPNGELTQKLLNEVAAARIALLNDERRAAYDAKLRQQLGLNDVETPEAPRVDEQQAKLAALGIAGPTPLAAEVADAVEPASGRSESPLHTPQPKKAPRRPPSKISLIITMVSAGFAALGVVLLLERIVNREQANPDPNEAVVVPQEPRDAPGPVVADKPAPAPGNHGAALLPATYSLYPCQMPQSSRGVSKNRQRQTVRRQSRSRERRA